MHIRWDLLFVTMALVAGLSLAGCSRAPRQASKASTTTGKAASKPLAPEDEFIVGPGVTFANLTLFPITSRTKRDTDRLITLDEGLAAGTVEVRELGAQSAVAPNPEARPAPAPAIDPFGDAAPPAGQVAANASAPSAPTDPFGDPPAVDADPSRVEVTLDEFGSNQVNRVLVHNKSNKPLYLMPGEIILGGDQDRTIGQELVIAPSDKPVEVEVFCVEHGRWGGKGQSETIEQLAALASSARAVTWSETGGGEGEIKPFPANLSITVEQRQVIHEKAAAADKGNFVVSAGALSKDARLAAQHAKNQGKVWDEVASANAKSGVKIQSGAFTGQYVEPEAAKRLDPYLQKLTKPIVEHRQVVGVVVAIDGKVESFDVFESTPLFRKLWPKLLKSYAVDAANAAEGRDAKETPPPCSQAVAAAFVKEAITADVTSEDQSGNLAIAQRDSEKVLLFTAHDPTQRPFVTSVIPVTDGATGISGRGAAGGLGGGFGGSVHGFGAAK
jgi:hypothetical protein